MKKFTFLTLSIIVFSILSNAEGRRNRGQSFSSPVLPILQPEELIPVKRANILTIDGGGARGVITAFFLTRLEEATGKSVADMFNMIAGTSTGGLQALALTIPNPENPTIPLHPASRLLSMYTKEINQFFAPKKFSFHGVIKPKYKSSVLYRKLKTELKDALLSQSLIDTLVTAYDIGRSEPKIFKSYKAAINPLYNYFDYDIARGTSAAPTYFKPAKIYSQESAFNEIKERILIDGGVFANDPCMCAFVEAKKIYPDAEEFFIVSLGTGRAQNSLSFKESQSMKGVSWASKFADISIDSSAVTVHYQMTSIAYADKNVKYYRFQPVLNSDISAMDDTSHQTVNRWIYAAEECVSSPEFHEVIQILSTPKTSKEELTSFSFGSYN